MSDEMRSLRSDGKHPIFRCEYVLPTPATEAVSAFVLDVVESQVTGAVITGPPRHGKTKSMRQVIADLLAGFKGKIAIIKVQVQFRGKMPSVKDHYTDALVAIKHPMLDGTVAKMQQRFREWVVSKVVESGEPRVVFIYDEAQFLWEHQFGFLMNDFNFWDDNKIRPTYLFVGQEEITFQRQSFILSEKTQLIGRFMVRHHRFFGIQNINELEECLKSYDERTEWPEKSGTSYTAFFFPAAFKSGWRLADQAELIYAAYKEVAQGRSNKLEIGMQYFAPVIEASFKALGDLDALCPPLSMEWLCEAIRSTGFLSVGDPGLGQRGRLS